MTGGDDRRRPLETWRIPLSGLGLSLPIGIFAHEIAVAVAIACILGLFVDEYVVGQVATSVLREIEPKLVGHDPYVLEEYRFVRGISSVRLQYDILIRIENAGGESTERRRFRARVTTRYTVLNYSGGLLKYDHQVNIYSTSKGEQAGIERVSVIGSDVSDEYSKRFPPLEEEFQRRVWIEESEKPQNRFEQTYGSLVE